jgi:hypothetical protein
MELQMPLSEQCERVVAALVVPRRSGAGYRLVVKSKSARGMPIVETLEKVYSTVDDALNSAMFEFRLTRRAIEICVDS